MSTWLRQSTAVDIAFGPFVDTADGFTPMTGLSITQAETRVKKNAGAWAARNDVTTGTHEEEGWYEVELDATDTNTLGTLIVATYVTGALPVWREFMVVTANVYDSIIAGGDTLDVTVDAASIDAILDDSIPLATAMYSATPTLRQILAVLAVLMRNEIRSDVDSVDVRNDANNATVWTYTSNDTGTVFTSGEAV